MKRFAIKVFFTIIILNFFVKVSAQKYFGGVPFIQNYSHEDYNGANQNFAIIQDDRGLLYFANQSTILEFDGRSWRHIKMPDKAVVYSFAKDKGVIYVGAKGDLGYLKPNKRGVMEYKSLKNKLPKEYADFKMIRDIAVAGNGKLLFGSGLAIYEYDGNNFKVHKTKDADTGKKNRFVSIFNCEGRIFIQEKGHGILEYTKQGKYEFMTGTKPLSEKWITGVFSTDPYNLKFISWDRGSYFNYKNGKLEEKQIDTLLRKIYKTKKIDDNTYAMGLFDGGLVITDQNMNIQQHVNTETGLQKDNVLALYVDNSKNIWVGLNNGISVVYANSPFSVYDDTYNLSSTTLTSIYYNGKLYVGNSTGVFSMDWDGRSPVKKENFEQVKGISSFQVWKLDSIDNTLFGSGASGIFTINKNTANFIKEGKSIKSFIQLKYRPSIILGTGSDGLMKISKRNGRWGNYTSVKGFKKDLKYINQYDRNIFWGADRAKGLFKLELSENLDSVVSVKEYNIEDGLPDKFENQLFEYDGKLLLCTKKGIFNYDEKNDIFIPNEYFTKLLGKDIYISDFVQDSTGNIWFKEKVSVKKDKHYWGLGLIKKENNTDEVIRAPYLCLRNNIHCIYPMSDKNIFIGTEKGFVIYDGKYIKYKNPDHKALLRQIELIKNDSVIFDGNFIDSAGIAISVQNPDNIPVFPFEYRNIRFVFSSDFYEKPQLTKYKYILEGNDKEWSDWKPDALRDYSNLSPGKYTFRVKAKNLYEQESSEVIYQFEIKSPYYLTIWAYIVYFILFILFIWGIIVFSTKRIQKQKENLERIVEERTKQIKAQNKELNQRNEEIKRKNMDITASINYAKRIQDAMLPIQKNIIAAFNDAFILFKPRDIVSGDFYWYAEKDNKIVITAVDCTGHGVPGAFMSMIGSELLSSIIGKETLQADEILQKMNEYVVAALKQEKTANQDGMDMALCVIDPENKQLEFAGAKNPLIFIRNDEVEYIRGSRNGIGGNQSDVSYEKHVINYESPTYFYIFSDGFQDQFGGEKNRKFMIKRLRNLLLEIHKLPGEEQKTILDNTIEDWMKDTEQTDDILLMGFQL